MTSHHMKRCVHCQVVYAYQASGSGCGRAENDDRYCPDCQGVVLEALKAIPLRMQQFTQVVTDQEEIKRVIAQHKRLSAKPPPDSMFPKMRQIRPGLFKHKDGDIVDVMDVFVIHLNGVEYDLQLWRKGSEPVKVTKTMERDLKTGRETTWRNL